MDFATAIDNWSALSSTGVVGEFFRLMEQLAKVAENTHKLLGLL